MAKREVKHGCPKGAGTVEPEHGGRIGNPPHEWSQEIADKVREFAELCNQQQTARRAGISVDTLIRHYHDEWQQGADATIYDVKNMLRRQALEEKSVNAGKALLVMAGEFKHKHEHSGPDGGPIRTLDQAKLAEMVNGKSDEELRALEQALSLVLAATGADGRPDDGVPAPGAYPGGAGTPGA